MMQYKGYLARVEFDDEASVFHGEVINTRDVITFQGKSTDELKKAFEDSVDDYLAFSSEPGSALRNDSKSGRETIRKGEKRGNG